MILDKKTSFQHFQYKIGQRLMLLGALGKKYFCFFCVNDVSSSLALARLIQNSNINSDDKRNGIRTIQRYFYWISLITLWFTIHTRSPQLWLGLWRPKSTRNNFYGLSAIEVTRCVRHKSQTAWWFSRGLRRPRVGFESTVHEATKSD